MLKKSEIQLVVCDLDGTLLKKDETLDSCIKDVLKNNDDYLFTLASGRNRVLIKKYIKELDIQIPYIANNGAEIIQRNQTLYQKNIVEEDLEVVLKLAIQYNLECLINCEACIFTIGDIHLMNKFRNRFINLLPIFDHAEISEVLKYGVQKIMFHHENMSVLDEFSSQVNFLCQNTICARAEGVSYCAKHKYADKGNALQKLVKILDVDINKVLVFGDNYNDINLFKIAKWSVAMDNAEEIVKKKADFITKSNEDNGVSLFLKKI